MKRSLKRATRYLSRPCHAGAAPSPGAEQILATLSNIRAMLPATIGVAALVGAGCAFAPRYLSITNHAALHHVGAVAVPMLCAPVSAAVLVWGRHRILGVIAVGLDRRSVRRPAPLVLRTRPPRRTTDVGRSGDVGEPLRRDAPTLTLSSDRLASRQTSSQFRSSHPKKPTGFLAPGLDADVSLPSLDTATVPAESACGVGFRSLHRGASMVTRLRSSPRTYD